MSRQLAVVAARIGSSRAAIQLHGVPLGGPIASKGAAALP